MKYIVIIVIAVVVGGVIAFYALNSYIYTEKQGDQNTEEPYNDEFMADTNIKIIPIEHASFILEWGDTVFYADPVGGAELYKNQQRPDMIILTDIHGDHLNVETLDAIVKEDTVIVAPKAVADQLPATGGNDGGPLGSRVVLLNNGDSAPYEPGFMITAVPMYNVPESEDAFHAKGRGNGYVIEHDGKRVYISGDTGNTPEVRALQNIDIAFLCMNLPYTMSIEDAAEATLAFKPKQVYPYHYRGTEGLSDVGKFKELVNASDPSIEVVQLNWYPN